MEDLRNRVEDPDAPTALIDDVARHGSDLAVRVVAVRHHKLPYPTMVELLHDDNDTIRAAAAAHFKMTSYLLADAATDPCEDVRCAVARHPHLRTATADLLCRDESEKVRRAVASGYAITSSALRSMQNHDRECGRSGAGIGPATAVA